MMRLLKILPLVSLLIIAALSALAGVKLRSLMEEDLLSQAQRQHALAAHHYRETLWKRYHPAIVPLSIQDPSQMRENAVAQEFGQMTGRFFQFMPLVRVNLYNPAGLLLMTANVNFPGKYALPQASPDAAFAARALKAGSGGAQSVNGPLQSQPDSKLAQSVIVLREEDGSVTGAVEILSDVTASWSRLQTFQGYATLGMVVLFSLFSAAHWLMSRKAESIIAKQHEANVELAAAAATAQAENQQKSQFLANISHELRTPLNAIIGFSDILKTEVIAPLDNRKYHDYINDIHGSGVHLLSLINDILDYSKAEAGKLELEVSEVNASKLIQNTMRLVTTRAETGKVRLVEALPKDQIVLHTDSKKFKQVLLNLLSNAVKFTPAGGEVRISAWRDLASESVTFEVRDTGIGIAPKDISRAMSPFGQVDSALSRKYEGTGLGLPLTKKFVELLGGKFTIESKVNVGTTVSFTLPNVLQSREGVTVKRVE